MKKTIIMLILLGVSFLIDCQKENVLTSPITFIDGEFAGTFIVTFINYKNTNIPVTQRGSIKFKFNDDFYKYEGQVEHSSDNQKPFKIRDDGRYEVKNNNINMVDDANLKMQPGWLPSLYLMSDYEYSWNGKILTISGKNIVLILGSKVSE